MHKRKTSAILMLMFAVVIIAFLVYLFISQLGIRPAVKQDDALVNLPEGFRMTVFASGLGGSPVSTPGPNPGPRMMLLRGGVVYVTIPSQGKVVALPDRNSDFASDETVPFIDNLGNPHGIDFYDGWFYIAEEERVIRVQDRDSDLRADKETLQVLIGNISTGRLPHGGHFTRTIKVHNGSLFISTGSSCNVCYEEDERRAAIMRCNPDGSNCSVFARGLRNAVGIVFHPITGALYATENGRDLLGDNVPPDELNVIEEGGNYGWPECYGKNILDTDFHKDDHVHIRAHCTEPFEQPSLVDFQAHSAPLGLTFYYGNQFPDDYRGDLFVAFHGSWNRGQPTGYKIVRVDRDTLRVHDFATGWLQGANVLGRPVDIIAAADGSLLVSDDNAGKIYRIYYGG